MEKEATEKTKTKGSETNRIWQADLHYNLDNHLMCLVVDLQGFQLGKAFYFQELDLNSNSKQCEISKLSGRLLLTSTSRGSRKSTQLHGGVQTGEIYFE